MKDCTRIKLSSGTSRKPGVPPVGVSMHRLGCSAVRRDWARHDESMLTTRQHSGSGVHPREPVLPKDDDCLEHRTRYIETSIDLCKTGLVRHEDRSRSGDAPILAMHGWTSWFDHHQPDVLHRPSHLDRRLLTLIGPAGSEIY
jgi:hypothetical protein